MLECPIGVEVGIEGRVRVNFQEVPVIETRPFHIFVIQRKTERFDQMERCPDGGAGSRNVAGILWNFRLVEYDVENH